LSQVNRAVVFAKPLVARVEPSVFELRTTEVPEVGPGQVLIQNHYLSINPLVRALIDSANLYSNPLKLGSVIPGHGAGQIIQSKHPDFQVGDYVTGSLGWQEYGVMSPTGLKRSIPTRSL